MAMANVNTKTRTLALFVDRIDDHPGGAERFVAEIATALSTRGRSVLLITSRGASGSLLEKAKAAGVHHVDLGRKSKADIWRLIALARILRTNRIEVLHTHKFGSNLPGVLLGRLSGTSTVIAQEHGWSYEGQRFRRLCDRYVIGRLATNFIAVSRADAAKMLSIERVPKRRVVVVPTALTPRSADDQSPNLRDELGLNPTAPIVLIVARLRPEKAVEVLIEAFAAIRVAVSDAQLVIAGDGPEKNVLRDFAIRLGLGNAVHFLGYREDVPHLVDASTVCTLVSDREGLPLWVLETMQGARPLVATRVGGIPEAIDDNVSGLLVPPRDPSALAVAVVSLLQDPERRKSMSAAAQARAIRDFSLDSVLDRLEALYDRG